MASLTLTVLRCPDSVAAEQRQLQGGELTIGRGAECGWSLADPLKSLSRNHCKLEFFGGAWQVRDLSVNGTFVNFSVTPVGRDAVQVLRDGDRLRLGDYEIELRIEERSYTVQAPASSAPSYDRAPAPSYDRSVQPLNPAAGPGFGGARLPGLDAPVDFSIGLGRPAHREHGLQDRAVPDHAASSADAYLPPAATPAPAAGKAIIPDDWWNAGAPTPAPPAAAVSAPAPVPVPVPVPSSAPAPAPSLAPPPQLAQPHHAGAAHQPDAGAAMAAALAALVQGGEVPPDLVVRAAADPEAALRNAGALLRVAITGIRALLIARGTVKREFRIEQTMLRPADNNPLKFAASDVHALAALLDPRTPGLSAVQESIGDLTLHQVAALAATQAAARALLERLAPSKIEADDVGGGLMPGAREKRLWEAYKRRHAKLLDQFEDDFESAFGTAFARAYEQAAADAKS